MKGILVCLSRGQRSEWQSISDSNESIATWFVHVVPRYQSTRLKPESNFYPRHRRTITPVRNFVAQGALIQEDNSTTPTLREFIHS